MRRSRSGESREPEYLKILLATLIFSVIHCPYAWGEGEHAEPRLHIKKTSFEFGSVSAGTKVEHDFEVENHGDAPLAIQRIVPACGCTASSVDTESIAPGEVGKIHVVFDTTGFSGEKLKTVRVYTNDSDQPSTLLSLNGTVEPDIIVEPRRVHFGGVTRGDTSKAAEREVVVRVREGSGVKIGEAKSFSKSLSVVKITSQPGEIKYKISLDPEAPLGELRERVMVTLSGAKRKSVNIPIFASIKGEVRLQPTAVAFGVLEGESILERTVKLENQGTQNIQLKKIVTNHPAVKASHKEIQAGRLYVIQVSVDPRKVSKDLRTAIEIMTDHPEQSKLSLSVYGIVPPEAPS